MMCRPGVGRQWTVAFTLFLGLGACGDDQFEKDQPLPVHAPLGLSETPVVVVGERADDPDHEFFRVVTPFLLSDGGIGVPLSSEGRIRIFDRSGNFVRALGSSGEGPGEFMGLAAAWARGDTIEAFDDRLNRVIRFVPTGAAETVVLEGVASAQSAVPGLLDGSWTLYGVKEVGRTGRDLIAVHRFAPDGSHLGELEEIHGFRRHVHDGGSGPDPISPRPLIRTGGSRLYMAETLTPRITEFDVSTGRTRAIGWTPRGTVSAAEAVAIARAEVIGPKGSQTDEAWTLASFNALTGDEASSVFWDFLIDGAEFVWVRGYDPKIHSVNVGGLTSTGSGGEWSVLDREGRHVTTVTVPEDFEPLSIDSDYLIGLRRDEFDVESVRVYRIERNNSRRDFPPGQHLPGRG